MGSPHYACALSSSSFPFWCLHTNLQTHAGSGEFGAISPHWTQAPLVTAYYSINFLFSFRFRFGVLVFYFSCAGALNGLLHFRVAFPPSTPPPLPTNGWNVISHAYMFGEAVANWWLGGKNRKTKKVDEEKLSALRPPTSKHTPFAVSVLC